MDTYSAVRTATRFHSILGTLHPDKPFFGFLPGNGTEAPASDETGPLQAAKVHIGQTQTTHCQIGQEEYYLQLLERGSCQIETASHTHTQRAGTVAVFNPDEAVTLHDEAGNEALIFRLSRQMVIDAAAEFGYVGRQNAIQFAPGLLTRQDDANLHHLLYAIATEHENNRGACDQATDYYARLLCLALLRGVPVNVQAGTHCRPTTNDRIEIIRNHVTRHIKDDMCIESLAMLCGVSVKTLYNQFNKECGKTPSAYIREMKLEAVHQCLSTDPDTHNVTHVALEYGFTNLSRFSSQYKALFGETPSITLKRTRKQSCSHASCLHTSGRQSTRPVPLFPSVNGIQAAS